MAGVRLACSRYISSRWASFSLATAAVCSTLSASRCLTPRFAVSSLESLSTSSPCRINKMITIMIRSDMIIMIRQDMMMMNNKCILWFRGGSGMDTLAAAVRRCTLSLQSRPLDTHLSRCQAVKDTSCSGANSLPMSCALSPPERHFFPVTEHHKQCPARLQQLLTACTTQLNTGFAILAVSFAAALGGGGGMPHL